MLYNDRDELQAAEARGKSTGREEKAIEVAKNLLQSGLSVYVISAATGLTLEQIKELK